MFQRFFYKLHLSEKIGIRKAFLNKEVTNLFLMVALVILGSIFFAGKSFVGAQEQVLSKPEILALNVANTTSSTSTASTAATTSQTTGSQLINLDNISPDTYNSILKSQQPDVTGDGITTTNTLSQDISIVPKNDTDITTFVNNTPNLLVTSHTTFKSQIMFDHIPDNSENIYKVLVAPTVSKEQVKQVLLDNGVTAQNATFDNIRTALEKASQDTKYSNIFLIKSDQPLFASSIRNTLLSTLSTDQLKQDLQTNGFQNLKDSLDILNKSASNVNKDGKNIRIQLKLPRSLYSIAGATETAHNQVSEVSGGEIIFTDPTQSHLFDVGNEAFLASNYPIDSLTRNPCSNSNYRFSDIAQCPNLNINQSIDNAPTLPLLPLTVGTITGGGVGGSFTSISAFYNLSAAQSYCDSLPDNIDPLKSERKQCHPNQITNPDNPGTSIIAKLYNPGTADACALKYFTTHNACPEESYNASFNNDRQLYFNFSKTGLGWPGGYNINYHTNELTYVSNEYAPNPLSDFNTVSTGKLNVDIHMDTPTNVDITTGKPSVGCPVKNACQGFRSDSMTAPVYCIGCGEVFKKNQLDSQTGNLLTIDAGSNISGKVKIVQNLFDYSSVGPLRYAEPSLSVKMISRTIGADGYPNVNAFYNPTDLLDISNGNSFIPLNSALPKALYYDCLNNGGLEGICNRYKDYKPLYVSRAALNGGGGLIKSNVDPNTFYGTAYMIKSNSYGTRDQDTGSFFAAYKSTGTDLYDYTDTFLKLGQGLVAVEISNLNAIPNDIKGGPHPQLYPNNPDKQFKAYKEPNEITVATSSLNHVISKSCSVSEDIYSTFMPIDDPQSKEQSPDFFTSFRGYDFDPTTGLFGPNCSDRYTKTQNIDFSKYGYWSQPIKFPRVQQVVTAKDPANNNVSGEILAFDHDRYGENGMTQGLLYLFHGDIAPESTIWQKYADNTPTGSVNISTADRINIYRNDFTTGNVINDFPHLNIPADLQLGKYKDNYEYKAAIAPDGTKYLMASSSRVALTGSGLIVLYKWKGDYPTSTELSQKVIYNIKDFIKDVPTNMNLTSLDISPTTYKISFGINLSYTNKTIKFKDGTDRKDPVDYTVGLIAEQKTFTDTTGIDKTGFIIYKFDLYEDSIRWNSPVAWLKSDTGPHVTLDPNILEVSYASDDNLYALINYAGNISRIQRVVRDATDQVVHECNVNNINFYTRFIQDGLEGNTSNAGIPDCTAIVRPTVEQDNIFGPSLSIYDIANSNGKYVGKQAADNQTVQTDFTAKLLVNPGPTGAPNRPSDDYVEATWSVSDQSLLAGPMFANDKDNTTLQDHLTNLIWSIKGGDKEAIRSQIKYICTQGNSLHRRFGYQLQVSCALLVATWGQENSFGTNGNTPVGFGCNNGDPTPICAAEVYNDQYKLYSNSAHTLPCSPFGKSYSNLPYKCPIDGNVKFATAYSYVEQRFTPTDLRFFDPNNRTDFDNQCVRLPEDPNAPSHIGIMLRPDQPQYCSGQIITNMNNPPHAAATDTRMNLRNALYGNFTKTGLKPLILSEIETNGGTVKSLLDDRILITTHFYP